MVVNGGRTGRRHGDGRLMTHKYRGSQQFSISKSVEPNEELKVE